MPSPILIASEAIHRLAAADAANVKLDLGEDHLVDAGDASCAGQIDAVNSKPNEVADYKTAAVADHGASHHQVVGCAEAGDYGDVATAFAVLLDAGVTAVVVDAGDDADAGAGAGAGNVDAGNRLLAGQQSVADGGAVAVPLQFDLHATGEQVVPSCLPAG